ncbi:cysteine desulfurase [Candidatus Puniceispirillum sp.]|nr:cysteine desulfurase [Candidatus Puniceispirillum sp.]
MIIRDMSIYLDNNATAPLRPTAIAAMQDAMGPPRNPSSVHGFGRNARFIVENARESLAMLVGCYPSDIVFTSGGTESNNLVLAQYDHLITSAIEHDSVRHVHNQCKTISVDKNGLINLDFLAGELAAIDEHKKTKTVVSVMAANNETGVLQPIDQIAEMARKANVAFHSDMVQIVGKSHLDFTHSQISYASLSAHKIGGPAGVGAILVRPGFKLANLMRGGGQEQGRRPGTENLIGIAGFGAAALEALNDIGHFNKMAVWRDEFETRMLAERSGIEVFGGVASRIGNTSCIAAAGKTAETMVMSFDLAGLAVSAGAACSSGKVKSSHVLEAMGADVRANEAIRISGGWATLKSDFERLADVFLQLYKQPT